MTILQSLPIPTEKRYVGSFTYIGPQDGAPRRHIVLAPDGSKHIIEAPEGVTPTEITTFAARVVPAPPSGYVASAPHAPIEMTQLVIQQDHKYHEASWHNLMQTSAFAVSLPAALLVIGWLLLWIGRGFKA